MPIPEEESLPFFSLNQRELFRRVGWFVQLRWMGIGCVLLSLLVVRLLYGPLNGILFVLLLVGVVAVYNFIFAAVNRAVHVAPARWKNIAFAWLQIVADLTVLTVVVHVTGGIASVFVIFYVVHLVIAAELLSRWDSFATAVFASVLLDLVVFLESAGVLAGHRYPIFTFDLAVTSESGGLWVMACLLYNTAFFLTAFMASSIATRLRESEREIERINQQLSALNTQKSAFMRMTGHEMRSPVNAILGLLHLLEKKMDARTIPAEDTALIARCRQRLYAMSDLIGDLLEYSRLQTVPTLWAKRALDLGEVVNRAVEELAPLAEAKEIPLRVDARKCRVEGDEDQLLTLTKNLVSNALRYTPTAGAVEISLWPEDNWAVLRVQDSGIGIGAESLRYVFNEFFRAPEAREQEPAGTGLGLTLCKAIIERHGGEIHVESEPGRGSVFTARLPIRQAD